MNPSSAFHLLHRDVQRWVWAQRWSALRDIQERAIAPILRGDRDVIISAATAAGKTEAAMLPACSYMAQSDTHGVGILYVCPLKALINDQHRRLHSLGESLDIPITPWHGDARQAPKNRQKKSPSGIILITPESLESLLLHHPKWLAWALSALHHIVIDEFHVFIDTERGYQLQSLLHRLEHTLGRFVPRIALSATLSDLPQVATYLRPHAQRPPAVLIRANPCPSEIRMQLRGYLDPPPHSGTAPRDNSPAALACIADDLFALLRGKSHLIFTNSRECTEELAVKLLENGLAHGVPNEFFPHHGSLAKPLREYVETRMAAGNLPTSAICTATLELGLDIGNVDSIAQISAPHTVARLRQRLGRSGRRSEPATLRLFIPEVKLNATTHISDRLRLDTVQGVAMVNLLLQRWCEPVPEPRYHFSTLVQQILSVIGQHGSARAHQLWHLLCKTGPFSLVDAPAFATLLQALGARGLVGQMSDGQLVLGRQGERYIHHHHFYAAFQTPAEYRLLWEDKTLGTIPITRALAEGQRIVFAGRRWEVLEIDKRKRIIHLHPDDAGLAPKFIGKGQAVHSAIRREMRRIYTEQSMPSYADNAAAETLKGGFALFHELGLQATDVWSTDSSVYLFPWQSDAVANAVAVFLRRAGIKAVAFRGVIEMHQYTRAQVGAALQHALQNPPPTPEEMVVFEPEIAEEKHDPLLPHALQALAYSQKHFDVDGARRWCETVLPQMN